MFRYVERARFIDLQYSNHTILNALTILYQVFRLRAASLYNRIPEVTHEHSELDQEEG